jgi:hypothetical protein
VDLLITKSTGTKAALATNVEVKASVEIKISEFANLFIIFIIITLALINQSYLTKLFNKVAYFSASFFWYSILFNSSLFDCLKSETIISNHTTTQINASMPNIIQSTFE